MDLLAKRSKLEFDNSVKLKQISDRISTKQAQLSDLVKKRTEQEEKITEIKSILESTEQAVADFEEYEKLKVEAESLRDKFEEYLVRTTELEREERELKSLEELFAEVSKSASLVSQVGCDEENKKRCPLMRVAWENYNRLDLLSASIVECQEKISALKSQVEQLQPMYDRVEQCSSLSVSLSYSVDAIARRSKALDDKKHIEKLIDEYNKSIALYTTELEELTKEQKDASTCYESELAAIDARLEEISELTKPLVDQEYILKQLEEESEQLQSQIEELRYEVGGIRAKVTSAENAREEFNIYYGELVDIEEKIALYKVIEKAASKKNGVPSLIVENTIPEIEAIANDLLDRVSDGRFSVHFETQKESKTTHSIQEVLKITVMDDGEPRAFQTYSGAQRFMLDFSIRVAISKFLAHRSGTEIKLLVIDEGFSALDNANFAKVVEVINEIAQDFEKVLIITHIDKLKTLLPQRINFSLVGKWTKVTIQGE
jgi:exonuclease SbcC